MAHDTRGRILDALQHVLVRSGPPAVTLEAVARAAGVSKGGLLYHFGSKRELFDGLIDRLADVTRAEIAAAKTGNGSIARSFLETAIPGKPEDSGMYWSVIAVLRASGSADKESTRKIRAIFSEWVNAVHDEIDDPVLAETIRLVGDGLFLCAVSGLPVPEEALRRQVFASLLARV